MSEQDSGGQMRPDEGGAQPPVLSAGEQLAAARQARGWSIEDVAAQLNLAPRQVRAIESGDHAALPGMPITRGFVRAYAKLLKIDAAPLLASLGGDTAAPVQTSTPRKVVAAPFAESRMPSLGERKRSPLPMIAIVAVVVLAVGGYWLLQNRELLGQITAASQSPATPAQAPEGSPPSTAEAPAEAGAPAADGPAAAMPAESAASPASPAPVTPQAASENPVPAAPAQAVPDNAPGAAAPAQPAPPASMAPAAAGDSMQLSAREETWVEIRRANGGAVVFSRLMKPGESQTVAVSEPLSVVIGNAGGIDLTLRGAPVALKGGSGNVSKITVK